MRKIPLTRSKFALVDDEDFDYLNQWKWHANPTRSGLYARRTGPRPAKRQIYMHREIMKCPDEMCVDHIDGNTLNNQKHNLRICTTNENIYNAKPKLCTSSKYKGVYFHQQAGKWATEIQHNYLGLFENEVDAAVAYDREAKRLFGNFAKLNFPKGIEQCQN